MKKLTKKGFTLTELLCVIVILGIVSTIATGSVISMSKKSHENIYCAKLQMIETKAYEYGKNHELQLNNSTTLYNGYKSITITIQDLINARLYEPDQDNLVINPLNNSSMNEEKIIIYLQDNQIKIYINDNNVC